MTNSDRYEFMDVLKNYANWTLFENILEDAYGKTIRDSKGYFEEKLGILEKKGIIGLWEVLDNVNRNNLLQAIRRYEASLLPNDVEDGKFWAENVNEKPNLLE
mgnify:CR=1 FL=1|jgi:hypothetical protein|tara:strand:- start:322 stop:630 length:309 start_codon:yes stop_codon:yes gene_type:complete